MELFSGDKESEQTRAYRGPLSPRPGARVLTMVNLQYSISIWTVIF
jgi:hypothetical protein